jgi:hypothetical protein
VATTRPETMLGDVAVAVNPGDKARAAFVGRFVQLPIAGVRIPIIADEHVEAGFGTGFVKITPAHDADDFEVGKRHGLPMPVVLTPEGRMADAALDGAPGGRGEVHADRGEAGIEGMDGRERELGNVLDARRERLTRWIQGTPPAVCVPRVLAWRRSRRRHRLAPKDRDRSSTVRPVHGRVSSNPSRTALPCPPQCGCRTVPLGLRTVYRVIHELAAEAWIRG